MSNRDAQTLQSAIAGYAGKLGLKVAATYLDDNHPTHPGSYAIDGVLVLPKARVVIDAEVFLHAFKQYDAVVSLLQRELDDLQLKLHDGAAAEMTTRDVRGRAFRLTDEDKHTLRDMYMQACSGMLHDFSNGDMLRRFQALMEKLYR